MLVVVALAVWRRHRGGAWLAALRHRAVLLAHAGRRGRRGWRPGILAGHHDQYPGPAAVRCPRDDRPRSAYVWTSLILVLAVLGAVLASRSRARGKAPARRPGRRRLAGPGRASQAAYHGQPAEARGVRRLVRGDRSRLRDGAPEQGRPGPRVGAGHGAAHRRVHAVRLDGTGGLPLSGLAGRCRCRSASSARRSAPIRATTWPKTTTSRPTTCAPRFPGSGGQAPTTSATQGYSGSAFLRRPRSAAITSRW